MMHVMVLGLRGFPGVQGGVETHAEHLYPRVVALGCRVTVIVRSPYMREFKESSYQGIRFARIWSPQGTGVEAFIHSFLGVLYAAWKRPDILHIHAIGPAIATPLARLFGLKVVVTHHGPDYDRDKWGRFARGILQTGEKWGMQFANQRIVISKVIQRLVKQKYNRSSELIANGVVIPEICASTDVLSQLNLKSKKYILQVSRFVPEKKQDDLIKAFIAASLSDVKLVLVGQLDESDPFTRSVIALSKQSDDIVLAGFQSGRSLQELYAHAAAFVLPSTHEGLPIVVLEALSYGLTVIASDIPANLEVGLPEAQYFPCGDVAALSNRLQKFATHVPQGKQQEEKCKALRTWVAEKYNWDTIARQTVALYEQVSR